jgi:orotidine-5'-phosphate decarboxylase
MKLKKPPGIIPALDLNLEDAIVLLEKLKPVEDKLAALKIGSLQAMDMGLTEAVSKLRDKSSLPIIYDHQKACTDIPSIVEKQVKMVSDCGASAFIAVPLGAGPKSLESFVKACTTYNILYIVLLEMTHEKANAYLVEGTPRKVFDKARELGVEYFVCPGNKPAMIKEYKSWDSKIKILSPGIGAQGGSIEEAVQAGCDYPIVGRAIYEADDPAGVVTEMYEKAKEGFDKR